MAYSVYILRDQFENLYIGQSNILETREHQHTHKTVKAAKYVKDNGNFKLVYQEGHLTQLETMRREKQLKGWTKAKKRLLFLEIQNYLKNLVSEKPNN